MELGLKGKYALVTGGSHGIGRSVALGLAEEGCNVAICARGKERLEEVKNEIKAFGVKALAIPADALDPEAIKPVIDVIEKNWETLHILINNVGGGGRWGSESIEETAENVWAEVYQKNAMAAAGFTRLCIPFMRCQKWGRVVTIGSRHGYEGGGRPWFTMAKSAQIALMKSLALTPYLVRDGITFNTVAPGGIMIPDTGWEKLMQQSPQEHLDFIDKNCPMGRLGTPEDVANVVVFLCSEKSRHVNGASITVDGSESRAF